MTTTTMSDPKPQQATEFTISAVLDEYPVTVRIVGTRKELQAAVRGLREIGAMPPTAVQTMRDEKAREVPVCPYHGPMKESAKAPGTYYCTKKMGDGTYCKEGA